MDAGEAWIAEKFPGARRKQQLLFLDCGGRWGAKKKSKALKTLSEEDVSEILPELSSIVKIILKKKSF